MITNEVEHESAPVRWIILSLRAPLLTIYYSLLLYYMMISYLLVLVLNFVLGDYKMTLQELLSSSVNLDHLSLVRTFRRQNEECQHVTEEVLVFQYKMKDKEGKNINETIVVTKEEEVEETVFQSGKNPEERGKKFFRGISFIKHALDLINIFHRWNCYPQDDPKLIESIKKHSLIPPSTAPYNLIGAPTHGDGQPRLLDQRYFMEKKKGGFFIEAGAWNGESESTTLHYELEHGWSGLLVEPIPGRFSELLTKQRILGSERLPLHPDITRDSEVLPGRYFRDHHGRNHGRQCHTPRWDHDAVSSLIFSSPFSWKPHSGLPQS